MFLTCHSYRQASWAPDVFSSGGVGSTVGQSITANNLRTVATPATRQTQIFIQSYSAHLFTNLTSTVTSHVGNVPVGTVGTEGVLALNTSVTIIQVGSTSSTAPGNSTTVFWTLNQETSYVILSSFAGLSINIFGTTSFHSTSNVTLIWIGSTTFTLYNNVFNGTNAASTNYSLNTLAFTSMSFGVFPNSSITASTVSTASSTFGSTSAAATSVNTTVTTTTAATYTIVSTATATTTRTIWQISGTEAVPVSTTATTIVASTSTITTATNATTTSMTVATPSWYGWSSERGTVLIATGNQLNNDLPAWLDKTSLAAGGAYAQWNCPFTTQTTIWPSPPYGVVHAIAVSQASNVSANTSAYTNPIQATVTLFGISTYTTTAAGTGISNFINSVDADYVTAAVPLVSVTVSITSYSTFTTTTVLPYVNAGNTATVTSSTAGAGGGPPDIITVLVGSTSFQSTRGTYTTAVTMTTMVSGYTTASAATGVGGLTLQIQTFTLTGPALSLTTTTVLQTMARGTNSPTAVVSTASAAASTIVTDTLLFSLVGGVVVSVMFTGTSTGSTTISGSASENFTQNVFSAQYNAWSDRYGLGGPASAPVLIIFPWQVSWWEPVQTMQGFSPWTAQSKIFANISSGGAGTIGLAPFETGTYVSYNSLGQPITSTSRALWAALAQPSIGTSSYTTASGTSTLTLTQNTILFRTFSTSNTSSNGTTAGTTVAVGITYPSNCDQAAATVQFTSSTSSTTSTGPGPTTTTGGSTASSYVGITYTNSVNSTFQEYYAFLLSLQFTRLYTTTVTINYFITVTIGTTVTAVTTSTITSGSTYTSQSYPSQSTAFPSIQFAPGVGGFPKFTGNAATINVVNGAVSLIGWSGGSSTTWSTATPNYLEIVIGASFTASSSQNTDFPRYTIPGQASIISSPISLISTRQDAGQGADVVATQFWQIPNPVLAPRDTVQK
jgi:hypothetical protein